MASRKFKLKHGEGPADGIRRVATGRAEKAIEALEEARSSGDAEAVHGARKDLKKLRSALRLVRDEIGRGAYSRDNERLREAGRMLSGARDAEVKVETLDALFEGEEDTPAGLVMEWRTRLEADRQVAAAELSGDPERVAGAISLVEAVRDEIPGWKLEDDSWDLFADGLDRAYSRGRKAMRTAVKSDFEAEDMHEWRKRAKDLWYQLRLLKGAWPEVLGATVDEVHELTDHLGDHHDLAVLLEDLESRRLESKGRRRCRRAIEAAQEELAERAVELGERVYAEKPRDFGRRIEAYWEAWTG